MISPGNASAVISCVANVDGRFKPDRKRRDRWKRFVEVRDAGALPRGVAKDVATDAGKA